MIRFAAVAVLVLLLPSLCMPTESSAAGRPARERSGPDPDWDSLPPLVEPGTSFDSPSWGTSATVSLSSDCPDTFFLYGGPGSPEGRFQTPQGIPDRQGWTGIDHSQVPVLWHVSTFNAENLGDHGLGNRAMWCGRSAEDEPGWATPPGYGNDEWTALRWSSGPLAQITASRTVSLDFFFNHDTEPGYDFFLVQYDSAGRWNTVLELDGTNRDGTGTFSAPGRRFSEVQRRPITFAPDSYGGDHRDEIIIRLLFRSDLGWSDEDGWFDTEGAVQVDDLSVIWSDGGSDQTSFEDFEGPGPYAWEPVEEPFAGDFTKVFPLFNEIDPCREDDSPVMTFIDDGTPPANDPLGRSTGGSLSPTWSYGVPGGWVVNYTGGLSFGGTRMHNSVLSPPIAWDLPGTCDDASDIVTLRVRWDHFQHAVGEPLPYYRYRFSTDGGTTWSPLIPMGGFWYGESRWFTEDVRLNLSAVVGDIPTNSHPTHVQWAFSLFEIGDLFGFPNDSTPASVIDNVAVYKVRTPGPAVSVRRFNDGFPVNGSIAVETQAQRDALDIPLFGLVSDPSELSDLQITATAEIPGTAVSAVRLYWILEKNPLFEDAIRSAPSRPEDQNVDTSDPLRWRGEVVASLISGDIFNGTWSADLPDVDFLYPGDALRYYAHVIDTDGRISTNPLNISGFESGDGYSELHQVRGLPSIHDASGAQPPMLLVLRKTAKPSLFRAPDQLGLVRGVDYDLYFMQPRYANTNGHGLGSAGGHGANADQLEGYRVIVFESERKPGQFPVLGDGMTRGTTDEVGLITSWRQRPGERHFALFGGHAAKSLQWSSALVSFLTNVLGVEFLDENSRDEIGGQQAPAVQPVSPYFAEPFVVQGQCGTEGGFDSVRPLGLATAGHLFSSRGGEPYPSPAASVLHEVVMNGDAKRSVFLPFGMDSIWDSRSGSGSPLSSRAVVLGEVLDFFGGVTRSGSAVASDPPRAPLLGEIRFFPNPFNPKVTLEFELGRQVHVTVDVYNLRGEHVTTLVDSEMSPGRQTLVWHGKDADGASVASGVYLYRIAVDGLVRTGKIALVR